MKIGLVRRGFSSTGGAEAYLRRFAQALVEAGHEAMLFGSNEWTEKEWPFGELRVISGRSPRAFADSLAAAKPKEQCDSLFSLERVWSCDCYRAGDGVHRAWLKRRERHEPPWKSWFRHLRPTHRELLALERRLFTSEATRLVIANSKMVRDEIVREFGYPADRIRVIYNGVPRTTGATTSGASAEDRAQITGHPERSEAQRNAVEGPRENSGDAALEKRSGVRRELGLMDSDYVVLFAGSGWERKGLKFAVEAVNAAHRPHLVFLVAGRGDGRALPRSPQTRFLGPVGDMQKLFAAADVFLLPTLYDPFSNACLEALAAGLPVITTADNGFSEIIESGRDGEILTDHADTVAITNAINAWSEPKRRAEARPRLREIASQFSVENNLRETIAAIQTLPS